MSSSGSGTSSTRRPRPGGSPTTWFHYPDARVLLLSATPYKPFTYAEENDEDHHRDFVRVLTFLANGCRRVEVGDVTETL